jgi:hypothetical protein
VLVVRDASSETKERSYCSCDGWREQKREAGMCSGCSERGGKEAGGDSRKKSDREMGGGGFGDGEKSEEKWRGYLREAVRVRLGGFYMG